MTHVTYVSKKGMFNATGMDALGYSDPKNDRILLREGLTETKEKEVRAHESEHIRKGEEGPFLGSLISGGLGLLGSVIGGNKASSGARQATQAAAYNPYGVSSGFGTAGFQGKQATGALSQPWQSKRDYYLGQADFFNQQLDQFRPPTRDQFFTGYGEGAAPTAMSYGDWSARQGARGTRAPSAGARPYAKGDTFYVPQSMVDQYGGLGSQGLGKAAQEYMTSPMRSSFSAGDIELAIDPRTGAPRQQDTSRSAYDRYVSGLDRGRGDATYDEEAFRAAREGYVSPEERIYNRLGKLAEPGEARQRSGLESRLFSQGMLGSTGGGQRTEALETSLGQKALGREQLSVSMAEEIQNMIQQRGIKATATAMGIDEQTLKQIEMGGRLGAYGTSAGATQASILERAGQGAGGAIANAFAGFGGSIKGLFDSGGSDVSGTNDYGIRSDFVPTQTPANYPSWWMQ